MSTRALSDLLLNPPAGRIAWVLAEDPHGGVEVLALSDYRHFGIVPESQAAQAAATIERLIEEIDQEIPILAGMEADLEAARYRWQLLLSHLRLLIAQRTRPAPEPAGSWTYQEPTMEDTISRLARERYGNRPDSVSRYLQDCERDQAHRERWWAV